MSDQCYCGQMSGQPSWTDQTWPGHAPEASGAGGGNNNLSQATDSYIRQFEEAYTASYSCKPAQCSPSKAASYVSYHGLSPTSAYYHHPPHLSPSKHQQHHYHSLTPEADQQHGLYPGAASYNNADYIQPCHIFQVRSKIY